MFDYIDDLATDLWLSSEDAIFPSAVPMFDPWAEDEDDYEDSYYESLIDSYAEASLFGWDS